MKLHDYNDHSMLTYRGNVSSVEWILISIESSVQICLISQADSIEKCVGLHDVKPTRQSIISSDRQTKNIEWKLMHSVMCTLDPMVYLPIRT